MQHIYNLKGIVVKVYNQEMSLKCHYRGFTRYKCQIDWTLAEKVYKKSCKFRNQIQMEIALFNLTIFNRNHETNNYFTLSNLSIYDILRKTETDPFTIPYSTITLFIISNIGFLMNTPPKKKNPK